MFYLIYEVPEKQSQCYCSEEIVCFFEVLTYNILSGTDILSYFYFQIIWKLTKQGNKGYMQHLGQASKTLGCKWT